MTLRFRNRIALFSSIAAAVTIGMVFLIVYEVVHRTAYQHLDKDLIQEQEEVMKTLHWNADSLIIDNMSEWEEQEHNQVEANPTFLQIVDAKGQLLFKTSNLQQVKLLINSGLRKTTFFNSTIDGQRSRQGQFPIINEHQSLIGFITVGISQEESANVLYNLRATLLIAFPLLLIVLFLATSFAAEKGILPVNKLIQAAEDISDQNMHERLPLPEHQDEIFRLASAINELIQRIEDSVQREKQFTADASHEPRTPLSGIRGNLEVLIRRNREPAYYEQKIKLVIREVDRMHQMLDQLLQLARLENGNLAVKNIPVYLPVFAADLAEKWQPKLNASGIKFNLQIPENVSLNTDPTLLEAILSNLLANAIKYGKTNGEISLQWDGSNKSLSIQDDGPGIESQHIPRLFDRFYRSDGSRNSEIPGAGLGLSIVKKLADLLNIQISVSSELDQGTTFILVFP
ncbi:MAG: HAMP domain-containing protein [Lewinellaceae bacterium]|nr:HAMP domain-containing protein [Lewinellaceae bacterium]